MTLSQNSCTLKQVYIFNPLIKVSCITQTVIYSCMVFVVNAKKSSKNRSMNRRSTCLIQFRMIKQHVLWSNLFSLLNKKQLLLFLILLFVDTIELWFNCVYFLCSSHVHIMFSFVWLLALLRSARTQMRCTLCFL